MANTPSNMLPLGTTAPDINLIDTVSEKMISLNDVKGETATVIMFICNHCPFVIHVNEQLIALSKDYKNNGVGFAAISSNDVENYPQDSPEQMKKLAEDSAQEAKKIDALLQDLQTKTKAISGMK